jgi:hypothetical protein
MSDMDWIERKAAAALAQAEDAVKGAETSLRLAKWSLLTAREVFAAVRAIRLGEGVPTTTTTTPPPKEET